jgi:signal transduction histidine kinase/CheY-like chemotaxis protein
VQPHDGPARPTAGELYADAPCGLLLTRADGTIERVNRTFCHWIGVEPDALVGGRRFADLLTMGGRIFHQTHFMPLLQMQGSVSEVKFDLVGIGGVPLPVMVNALRRSRDGIVHDEIAVFVAKERHVYERELMRSRRHAEELAERHLEAQKALQQADRRKDEFLAMLAHELRNPLAPISSSAHLLKWGAHDAGRVREVADVIARQIGHLTNLVDDLLDVSRVTRGLIELEKTAVDMAGATRAAIEQARPLIDARGHTLHLDLPTGLAVEGDRTRLVQIIANLLSNAAKYTPPGGSITVDLAAVDDQVRVRVTDNGIGFDNVLLPHIFDLFSQAERTPDRSQGGLGIGLALVKNLVDMHGGHIEARSDGPDRGSRFTVWLPVSGRTATPATEPGHAAAEETAPLRVLVVDDNQDAASTLADVIRLGGHEPILAASGTAALARLAPGQPRPDACILDIGLPDMTGYELATRLREADPARVPLLIALTGYGQPDDRLLSTAAGFDRHLVKPADTEEILALLGERARRIRPQSGEELRA